MVKNIFPLIIVGIFAFVAGLPLLHKGLPPTHDGEYHVVRFYEFDKSLRDGNWYPRWAADLNNGYGVPLFNYVYPLPNYVASFFHFLGFSFIDSFKLNMFFALVFGSVFFYLWAKGFWGVWGGLVGSIFYTFSPYHFVDIYIRGSVGEVWALGFFPAFLWSITQFVNNQKLIFLVSSSVFLSHIIFSHNILALIFFPFALSYYGFLLLGDKGGKGDYKRWIKGIFVFILGIGLSSIFWLPALFEKQYVVGLEVFGFEKHFPDLYQLIVPSWGSGFSGENLGSSLSFQIGIANLLVVIVVLFSMLFRHYGLPRIPLSKRFWMRFAYQNDGKMSISFFFMVWFFIIFFLMLKASLPIWKIASFMNYLQFPWRFLSLEILIASFLAGSVVQLIHQTRFNKFKSFVFLCLVILAFTLGIGYAKPAHYLYRDDNYYISRSNFIDGTNSPSNAFNTIWMNRNLKKEKEKIKFAKGEGKIISSSTVSTHYKFDIVIKTPSEMIVSTAYFPGWTVFVDRKREKVRYNKDGIMAFSVPKGELSVDVKLLNTNLQKLASFVTLVAVLFCTLMLSVSLRGALWKR